MSDKALPKERFSIKGAIAILIGNFFEYFDLLLYANLMFIISPLFFPKSDPKVQFIFEAASFALGWIVRPVAALVFGYIADYISRKQMLLISTLMMGVATFCIASAPTYEQIGLFASAIILVCRVLQGFSTVGEFVGSTIYLVESAPAKYKNLFSSFVYISSTLGGLCAALCGSLCIRLLGENPGWRVPFYIGSCIMLLGGFLRRLLPDHQPAIKKKVILWKDLWEKRWPAIGGVLINMCHPIVFYMAYAYIPKILKNDIGCSSDGILLQSSLVLVYEIIVVVALGYIGDIMSIIKIAYWRSASVVLFSVPCVWCIGFGTISSLFWAQIILITISHAELPLLPASVKSFSGQRVYTSYGFVWSVGRSIMYGLAPLLFNISDAYFGTWGFVFVLWIMAALYCSGVFCMFRDGKELVDSDAIKQQSPASI